uniref:diacylglycerol O-acyltransferase n=1 Tax=Romanomermis culicivorax TaxID=13658 RepID=A0A915IKV0_ROMCU
MTQIFGVKFAPLFIPLHRRVETFAIVFHLFMFFISPFLSLFLTVYLLFFTNYWYLVLLYGLWFIYDFETPRKGTRRLNWFRNLGLWKYYHDYFPLTLVKTANMDKTQNYIFGCHPHGIISMGVGNIFGSESENVSERFGLSFYICTLKSQFYFPLRREYYMACGAIEVSKESINYVLNQRTKGNAVVIVVGGAAEALDAFPGTYTMTLENRKGFIKLALQNG